MGIKHLVTLLVLLALAVLAAPAHAGGVVGICDQAHLLEALAGGGTVTFSCSGTITLTSAITIAADTTIDGSGQNVTISGNNAVRVFTVPAGVTLNVNRLTIADGYTEFDYGGGIYTLQGTVVVSNSTFSGNRSGFDGGGIFNLWGALTVSNSTFSGNEDAAISNHGRASVTNSTFSGNDGSGIYNNGTLTVTNSTFSGNNEGGIFDAGGSTLTVSDSTFSGNSAGDSGGGGIANYGGTATVSNSTFFGNTAITNGGGIFQGSGTMSVTNCTLSGNSATNGGGIYAYPEAAVLMNTIVTSSPAGGNCSGTITDGGGNLSYPDATCPGINGALLGFLRNNGGSTYTMALRPGSAAVDAANDAICAAAPVNNLDQRGVSRPEGPHCDIGSFEGTQVLIWLPVLLR